MNNNSIWIPKRNEPYFYVDTNLEFQQTEWFGYAPDVSRLLSGNIFKTLGEAVTYMNVLVDLRNALRNDRRNEALKLIGSIRTSVAA